MILPHNLSSLVKYGSVSGIEFFLRGDSWHWDLAFVGPVRLESGLNWWLMVRAVPSWIFENGIVSRMSVYFGCYFCQGLTDWNGLLPNPKIWPLCPPEEGVIVFYLSSLIPSPADFLLVHLNHHFVIVIVGRPHVSFVLEKQFLFQILSTKFRISRCWLIFHMILALRGICARRDLVAWLVTTYRNRRVLFDIKLFDVLVWNFSLLWMTFLNFFRWLLNIWCTWFANLLNFQSWLRLPWIPNEVLLYVNLKILVILNRFVWPTLVFNWFKGL